MSARRIDRLPEPVKVADAMTRNLAAVSPETAIHDAVRLLIKEDLSGLPVVDSAFRVIGVLSERDLQTRLCRRRRSWWDFLSDGDRMAREYRKAVGTTVGDAMTHPVPMVGPEDSLESAAALFEDLRISVIPVVSWGHFVGTISRRDLVKRLLTVPVVQAHRSDADLLAQMRERMAQEVWVSKPHPTVYADNGVLTLSGLVASEAEKAALLTMARALPGCRGVEDHLVSRGAIHAYHEMV